MFLIFIGKQEKYEPQQKENIGAGRFDYGKNDRHQDSCPVDKNRNIVGNRKIHGIQDILFQIRGYKHSKTCCHAELEAIS